MSEFGMRMRTSFWSVIAALALIFVPSASADVVTSGPPPISEATAESELMIYAPEGSPNALEGDTAHESPGAPEPEAGLSGFPVEGNTGPMPFNGGYVQHRPYVHLIFWGSEWNSYPGTREKLIGLFQGLNNSSYANILTQYFDHSGYISSETDLTSFTDTRVLRPPQVSNEDAQTEINWAIQNHPGWGSIALDNQYIVVSPPGTPAGSCAYHAWSGQFAFAYIPWSPPECRRGLEPWGAMQVTASHEWSEMATDPIPVDGYWGWTINVIQGEIADLCNTGTAAEHVEIAPGVFAAKLLDDYLWAANDTPCVAQDATPIRYQTSTGASSLGVHQATLNGTVNPGGWPAYYQFVFMGPEGTTYIPARSGSPEKHYGFAPIGQGFGNAPASAQVSGLKGNTTYKVRLESLGALTEPRVLSNWGVLQIFNGGETQFTTPDWRPALSLVGSSEVKAHSAKLNATINPQGTETTYQFEYGTTQTYGTKVPVSPENIGAGSSGVSISKEISGLEIGTTYHFRVVATNAEGTSNGSDLEFKTPSKPAATTEAPYYTNTFEPQLNATIDPERADTHYQFEYGKTTSYGTNVPVPAEDLGSGDAPVAVNQALKGLERNTTYHYRITAENEVGTTKGADQSFTTLPLCKGAEAKCLWATQTAADPPPILESEMKGVSCGSSSMCLAIGKDLHVKNSFVELWDGSKWSLLQSAPGEMRQVSCASATACVAVGAAAKGGIQSWMIYNMGGGWVVSEVTPPTPAGGTEAVLQGVSCTTTACTAVGSYQSGSGYKPLVERWNGSTWSLQTAPSPTEGTAQKAMLSVSCSSATSCITVGEAASKPVAESWNGTAWSLMSAPNPSGAKSATLASVSCTSATFCMASGNSYETFGNEKALTERWNGSSWSIISSPYPSEAKGFVNLAGVSCTSSTSCTAAGYYASSLSGGGPSENKTLAEFWNGTEWTIQSSPNVSGQPYNALLGVSCTATSACTAVGGSSPSAYGAPSTLAERWNGSSWSIQTTVNPTAATEDELKSVSCGSITLCVAVGRDLYRKNSFVDLWNGTEWKFLQSTTGEIKHVSCASAVACVAVGASNSGTAQSWLIYAEGKSWVISESIPPNPAGGTEAVLQGVSCTATACTAVGSYQSGSGYKPLVERWNGSTWSLQTAPNPAEGSAVNAMLSVSCSSSTSCMAVGEAASKPVAEIWNGSEWSLTSPPNPAGAKGAKLTGVSCAEHSSSCMAVGSYYETAGNEKTLTERWNGSSWSIVSSPNPSEAKGFVNLIDVSCLSPNSCFAGGYYASSVTEGTSLENKTLVETWNGTEWTIQSSPNAAGKPYSVLWGISCTSSIICTAVGAASPGPYSAPSLLAERYG